MYAVIMAGGKGARFWPRSREAMPKHLLDILCEKTIIQQTVDRIKTLIPPANIFIVTGKSHADEVVRQLPEVPGENILVEPVGRNTAPCIGLAAIAVKQKEPEGVMVVLPSDHMISDEPSFLEHISAAAEMAQMGEYLLTIGIKPTAPETGYGYIEKGEEISTVRNKPVYKVKAIREKPDAETARKFLKRGRFLWNSGMFVWRASVIKDAIEKYLPDIHKELQKIEKAFGSKRKNKVIESSYRAMTGISIDYGVMEKARNVLVIPGDFGWSDVGSWDALWDISEKDADGNVVKCPFIGINAANSLVHSSKKLVALVGVEDLLVVETDDALLICKRGASQDVKRVVDRLTENEQEQYL